MNCVYNKNQYNAIINRKDYDGSPLYYLDKMEDLEMNNADINAEFRRFANTYIYPYSSYDNDNYAYMKITTSN